MIAPQCIASWRAAQPHGGDFRYFAGVSKDFDPREIFVKCIRDPEQLQPTLDVFAEQMEEAKKKRVKEK